MAKTLAQTMQEFPSLPPLEVQSMQACEEAIAAALNKYGCRVVFEQVSRNGLPVGGRFVVEKIREPVKQ